MTKLQLLHRALNERMMEAVEQIMEMVGGTVLEYEEETARVRKENEDMRRRLQSMEDTNRANWPGPYDPVGLSTLDESTSSQQEQCAVSFEFEQESQTVLIKTEFTDDPLFIRPVNGFATLPQSADQGSPIAGTSASITYGQTESAKWPSTQSYMEPLEFDPTPSTMFTYGAAPGKRQRMSFACPDCGKVFGREQTLMFHLRTHSAAKPYEYRRRKTCFYGDGLRKRKLRGLSKISRENTADVSDGSGQANRSRPSAEHPAEERELDSLSTNSNKTSNASVPENIASNTEPLQRKKVTKSLKKKYNCSMCGDRFSTSERLEFHMKSHEVNAEKSPNLPSKEEGPKKVPGGRHIFPCMKCDKVFSHLRSFNSHMRMSHLSEQEDCDGESESESETTEVSQKETTKKIRSCPHCGKVYINKGCLRTHIRTVHTPKKTSAYFQIISGFGRTRSQRSFSKQLTNTIDEATLHDAETHVCENCNKEYASSTWLSKHMCVTGKEEQPVLKKLSKTGEMQCNKGRASKKNSSSVKSLFHLTLPETLKKSSRYPDRVPRVFKRGGILPDVTLNEVSMEKRHQLYVKSAKPNGKPRPERFAILMLKSFVPPDVYHKWARTVNFDGSRGKNALPNNLREAILKAVEQTFEFPMTGDKFNLIKERINVFLRYKRLTLPRSLKH